MADLGSGPMRLVRRSLLHWGNRLEESIADSITVSKTRKYDQRVEVGIKHKRVDC